MPLEPAISTAPSIRHAVAVNWPTQQLTGFLAVVSATGNERTASRSAVERAAEALDA